MNLSRSRTKAIAIALFLMFAMVISSLALSPVNAQDSKKTYPYIGAVPNPVGVGQETLLHLGITDPHALGAGYGWEGDNGDCHAA